MSAPVNFTISEYAPTVYRESNEDYHLDGYRVTEQNPALPGETILNTGITGLGAAPNPEVTMTLGGLPVEIVALDEVYMDARRSGPEGHYVLEEVELPGIYTMQWIVPPGIEPGWQSGTLSVAGVTFTPPDDIGSQIYIGGGGGSGGGGEGTPSISEGGIVLASLLPTVNTVSPLSIISIFGEEFSTETILFPNLDENGNLDTNLGGFCAEIGGERSSIFAITPTQANIQTPGTPTLGPVDVVAIRNCDTPDEVRSSVAMVTVEEATPGFFLFPPLADDGFIAARFNATPEQTAAAVAPEGMFPDDPLGPSRPAMPGEIILLFGTGWGPTTAGLAVGELAPSAAQVLPEANPTVMFAGLPLAPENVFYVGVTPGTAGLLQLAIRIPEGTPPGNHPVVLTVYGKSTPVGPLVPVKAP
jgi:uncharacterized protein (TIGR03437 family)